MADPKQIMARTIEKIVRKDLDSSAQLPFQILLPENGGLPPQSLLTGMVSGAVRARANNMIKEISQFYWRIGNVRSPQQ